MPRRRRPPGLGAKDAVVLVSCEHGGNQVPAAYRSLFADAEAALASHRGWDAGALSLGRFLARRLRAVLFPAKVSRLVVDLNRSTHHPRVLSEWTRALPPAERRALLARWHAPHRGAVDNRVSTALGEGGRVLHVGVHSFTPVLNGSERRADIGLLYDPSRPEERGLARAWAHGLAEALPHLAIRRNQPYRGVSDGLTTWLRKRHGEAYVGIEVEVNQRLLDARGRFPARVAEALANTLAEVAPLGAAAG